MIKTKKTQTEMFYSAGRFNIIKGLDEKVGGKLNDKMIQRIVESELYEFFRDELIKDYNKTFK